MSKRFLLDLTVPRFTKKGIDKQDNMRAGAIMIACGLSEGGSSSNSSQVFAKGFSQWIRSLLPDFIGGGDADVILPDSAYPKVTQSESMEWGGPNNTWGSSTTTTVALLEAATAVCPI